MKDTNTNSKCHELKVKEGSVTYDNELFRADDLQHGDFIDYTAYEQSSNITNNAKHTSGTVTYGSPNTKAICVNFVTVIVSTLGLIVLVIAYSMLGGAVFEWLESNSENETIVNDRRHVAALVKQHAANLYAQLQLDASIQSIDTVDTVSSILIQVSTDAFKMGDEGNWDGNPQGHNVTLDWTFSGAVLFAVTTITTIGYGFIAPKTVTGRVICIFYSVFGIPITMLAIANLGLWFAKQVRKVHRSVSKCNNKNIDASQITEVPVIVSLLIMVAYIFGGAGLFAKWEDNIGFVDGAYFCFITLTTIGFGDIVPGVYTGKGDWITKDNQVQSGGEALKLIICGVYLFFGLSLLAMCLDLMKEEVRANFLWLGYKTNLMSSKTPEEVIEEYIKQQTGG